MKSQGTKRNTLLVCILATVLVSGCSSKKEDFNPFAGLTRDQFQPHIKANGLKIFIYRAHLKMDKAAAYRSYAKLKSNKKQKKKAKSDRREIELAWIKQVELGLTKTLAMNKFCRDGYIELDRLIESNRGEIRGECLDGASAQDHQKYGHSS